MKNILKITLVASLGVMMLTPSIRAETPEEADQVTQGELAEMLVNLMGLARFLPNPATPQEMCAALIANGCAPADGWQVDKVVTKAVLARVLVQAMGMEADVEDPNDPNSWVKCLKENGIPIDTIGEALQNVDPSVEPITDYVLGQGTSTDPLKKQQVFGLPDEKQFGVDLESAPIITPTLLEVQRVISSVTTTKAPVLPVTPDGGEGA